MERAILNQLHPLLVQNRVKTTFQSYRKFHSIEIAVCKIYNDLVLNTCSGKSSFVVLLDLSTDILGDFSGFGIEDSALSILKSYLLDCAQRVIVRETTSEPSVPLQFGLLQESVLVPIWFVV